MRKAFNFVLVLMIACGCSTAPVSVTGEDIIMQAPSKVESPVGGELASLRNAKVWLNSPPLTAEELRGKVVLVHFWTYTCINWLRAEPYIRAWAEKYKQKGLVVIGVHTPEFEFEKDLNNVRRAAANLTVPYPIAVDSEYRIWNGFANRYWPALYFIDAQGRIRHHRFGEGDYERSERVIQKLLAEAGGSDIPNDLAPVNGQGVFAAADWGNLGSGENYLGYDRTVNFASPGNAIRNKAASYSLPPKFARKEWALAGDWVIGGSEARTEKPGGRVVYRFRARDLHLVMGPAAIVATVRFRVLLDGKPPGKSHGIDVDDDGYGAISAPRMYQLIRQLGPVADQQFEIEFLDPGAKIYAFTFG